MSMNKEFAKERRSELGYQYWLTLAETDRISLQECYGEVATMDKNQEALDAIFLENLSVCFAPREDYILNILQNRLDKGIHTMSTLEYAHAKNITTIRFFETKAEKEAYMQALEDVDAKYKLYPSFIARLIYDYVGDN